MGSSRRLKAALTQVNRFTERGGLRIQPVHYYSEVPNRAWLQENKAIWNKPVVPYGTTWDIETQLAWVEAVTHPYRHEVEGLRSYEELAGRGFGPGYGAIESQVLHCAVRAEPPSRIVEIGSGVSTAVMSEAVQRNVSEGRGGSDITCIEPFPYDALTRMDIELIDKPAQLVERGVFEQLGAGDLLFIDSTHTVRTGSEVLSIYLEILPRLREGVRIHIHDIFLPYLFHPNIFDHLFDWQETALLAALLTSNDRLHVDTCLSALVQDRLQALCAALPDMVPPHMHGGLFVPGTGGHFPSSTWLRVVE